jgi:hypothetical protein
MATDKITSYDLIVRHLGDELYIIYIDNDELIDISGKLIEVNHNYISIKTGTLYKDTTKIEFREEKLKKIIHIYNSSFVDLFTGKEAVALSFKLRNSENQKSIISNIKPFLGNELAFVYKQNDGVALSVGKFLDMGVRGIQLRLAPFYNSDISLTYDKILHIYDNRLVDLIKLAPKVL